MRVMPEQSILPAPARRLHRVPARPAAAPALRLRSGLISTERRTVRTRQRWAKTRPMTTTASPPATLTDRTALGLLHQRVLLLDRELDMDNGAQL